jgi:hypothetical protein
LDAVEPTLAVVISWVVLVLLLAGVGVVVEWGLTSLTRETLVPRFAGACWLGLAALLAYLQLWNVFFAVTWWAWVIPVAPAAVGFIVLARRSRRLAQGSRGLIAGGLALLAVVWLANHAIGAASDYDLGLYHLGIIEYAKHYATIPGLANLQTRFGASDPHLLLAALVDRGPWAGAGWHLVDGLLVSLLVLELATRLAPAPLVMPSFRRRVAWLLIPATVVVVGSAVDYRLASPNLDLACFVLVAVGMLYLTDCVEDGFRAVPAITCLATLAAAAATRPLYWPLTFAAFGILLASGPRPRAKPRRIAALSVLPAVLLVGWMTRQAILSGYPLYPVKLGALPVDWRVPASVVDYTSRWTASWARWPGQAPDTVLASWHWLRAFWLPAEEKSIDVIAPLALLACVPPALAVRREGRATRRAFRRPMLAVAGPSLVTLVIWFAEAPDPRFVLAPLWLFPISLAAWATPPITRNERLCLAAGIGVGLGLAVLELHQSAWYLPAAFLLPLYLLGLLWIIRRPRLLPALAYVVLLATASGGALVVAYHQQLRPVRVNSNGPFGISDEEAPRLVTIRTAAGLHLRQPFSAATGNDQCFEILVCTAALSDPALHDVLSPLHLRGTGISSGFSVRARLAR